MRVVLSVVTVATWYAGPYVEKPLYCGGVYADTTAPWVALPIEQYGDWQCGDLVYLSFGNGDALMARAMDAGPFGDNCVLQVDGTCAPIVADVPWHLWPESRARDRSAAARVVNVTAECRARGICD